MKADGSGCPGSYDGSVRLWDAKSQSTKSLMTLTEARDSVSTIAVVEHEIMSGSVDGRVRTYDIRMGMAYADVIGRRLSFFAGSSSLSSRRRSWSKFVGHKRLFYER